MSVYLYRWGKFAFRRKWIVLPVWLLIFVIIGALGFGLKKPVKDDFNIPNLPSQRATDILDKQFPGMSAQFRFDAVTGTYVIGAPAGQKLTDPAGRDAITELVQKLGKLNIVDHSRPLMDPIAATETMGCLTGDSGDPAFIARCGLAPLNVLGKGDTSTAPADTVAYLQVPFSIKKFSDVTATDRTAAYDVADVARSAGLTVEMDGTIATNQTIDTGASEMVATSSHSS